MDIDNIALALKELGHSKRLSLFKQLVKAGPKGLSVGELQKRLDIPGSTLSHHLSALSSAGLIRQQREGRILHCIAQYDRLNNIITFFLEECCSAPETLV